MSSSSLELISKVCYVQEIAEVFVHNYPHKCIEIKNQF